MDTDYWKDKSQPTNARDEGVWAINLKERSDDK